jgi:hypothetical protein
MQGLFEGDVVMMTSRFSHTALSLQEILIVKS